MKKIFCQHYQKILEGFEEQFYPGKIGKKIYKNISKKGWKKWIKEQTIFINENNLNMTNQEHIKQVEQHMINFLFHKSFQDKS
ncbi:oxidative damage protection protein [Buchnera aphidicola]|uniref:Oxidative damage protection protein n=1 Tax=Buchnera aphidicola (Sarucallis kahawaluokalani) TaxID=1241878 RepID=A0A4D6Y8A3_9GAMM|nr:oxidative damage protection protein [Buchnera aphidicola]QCI26156.1 oxidative damage protection protein [Buchnera aphidicola (Sarucallis kahawaluokalani)]